MSKNDLENKLPEGVPEFLYHFMSKAHYEMIKKDGVLGFSAWENKSNGCEGIYFVEKNNMLNHWIGYRNPKYFGDYDIGEVLLRFTGAETEDGIVALKFPTKSLDISKLKFRPYVEACRHVLENIDTTTLTYDSELVKKGLELNELPKYIDKEPVEFMYLEKLPLSLVVSDKSAKGNLPYSEILAKILV